MAAWLTHAEGRDASSRRHKQDFLLSCGFIFLHELAHLELGHLKTTTTKPEKKIQHEYDADDWAVQYVIEGCEPDELGPRLIAIALTFGLVGGAELEGSVGDMREHPFPPDRIMHFVTEHVILATQERSLWAGVLLAAAVPIEANLLRKKLPSRWPLVSFEEYFAEAKKQYPS